MSVTNVDDLTAPNTDQIFSPSDEAPPYVPETGDRTTITETVLKT
jgi:hypothetical protein